MLRGNYDKSDWFWSQSIVFTKPECRWTWPQVAILDANQKVRGMLETRMPITDHGQGTYINPKLNSNKPILCSKS